MFANEEPELKKARSTTKNIPRPRTKEENSTTAERQVIPVNIRAMGHDHVYSKNVFVEIIPTTENIADKSFPSPKMNKSSQTESINDTSQTESTDPLPPSKINDTPQTEYPTNKSNKEKYLVNGNIFYDKYGKHLKINHQEISLFNTCAHDALLELFTHSYDQFPQFRDQVNRFKSSSNHDFLHLISKYSELGECLEVYQLRAQVLVNSNGPPKNGSLNCWSSISKQARVLLKNRRGFNSLRSSSCVYNCDVEEMELFTLEVEIYKENIFFNELQKAVEKLIQPQSDHCPACHFAGEPGVHTASVQLHLEHFLLINVEFVFRFNATTKSRVKCTVKDVPPKLNLGSNEYSLAGVIQFKGENHFISICKLENDEWEIQDDLKIDNEKRKLSSSEVDERISLSVILYIKS